MTLYMVSRERDLKCLQLIQNAACRTILREGMRTSISYMHAVLDLPKLHDRRDFHLKIECYKNASNPLASLNNMFTLEASIRSRVTRDTDALSMHAPDIRSNVGCKSFSYRGPFPWNHINELLRQSESLQVFKTHLTKDMCRDVNHPC